MPLNELLNPILCIGWLIVGAIAGAIANNVMKGGNQPLINDIVLGIVGSWIAGLVLSVLGLRQPVGGGLTEVLLNLLISTIGAIILIAIVRAVRRAT